MSKRVGRKAIRKRAASPAVAEKPLPHAGAVRVARELQIRDVRLVAFTADASSNAFSDEPGDANVSIGFTKPLVVYSNKAVAITTTFKFRINGANAPEASPPTVIVTATTELAYSVRSSNALDKKDLDDFAVVNAPFNAWPYWREFVQSSLTRLGLPAFVLPLFRIEEAEGFILLESD